MGIISSCNDNKIKTIVLLETHFTGINRTRYKQEVFRLNDRKRWELLSFSGEEASVEFASVGLECSIVDLYEDVDFDIRE